MKDLRLINFCLIVLVAFFANTGTECAAKQPVFTVPADFCRIFLTRAVNTEVIDSFQDAFEERMKTRCVLGEKWVSQSLNPSERKVFVGVAKTFVLWMDFEKSKEEVIVAIFSPENGLRIAQSRARIGALTSHALVTVFADLIDGLLDQIPYLGFWEGPSFYTWARVSNVRVKAVKAGPPQKHPFLPEEKWVPGEPGNVSELSLSKTEAGWSLSSVEGKTLTGPNQRLWLFPTR